MLDGALEVLGGGGLAGLLTRPTNTTSPGRKKAKMAVADHLEWPSLEQTKRKYDLHLRAVHRDGEDVEAPGQDDDGQVEDDGARHAGSSAAGSS